MRIVIAVQVGDPDLLLGGTVNMCMEGLHAVASTLVQHEVLIVPFGSDWTVGFADCIRPVSENCLTFATGEFRVSAIEENVVRWCSIDSVAGMRASFTTLRRALDDAQLAPLDRVVVLTRSTPTQSIPFTYPSNRFAPFVSIVVVGELCTEHVAMLQALTAAHGGFLFSNVRGIENMTEVFTTGIETFLALASHDLEVRRRMKINYMSDSDPGVFSGLPLSPGQHLRKALLHDPTDPSFKWTVGIRMIRESQRGVRDIVCCEDTPLGLELSPPTAEIESWTVLRTHPPISGLGIKQGSRLIVIHGNPVSEDREQTISGLTKRPLIASIVTPDVPIENPTDAWINCMSEEICAYIWNLRACDKSSTATLPLSLLNAPPPPGLFSEAASVASHPIFQREVFNGFFALVQSVYPAIMIEPSATTRRLLAESFPFEYAFSRFVLTISLADNDCFERLRSLNQSEGPCSPCWVRIFLALVSAIDLEPGKDPIMQALQMTSADRVTDAILDAASHVGVTGTIDP